jgi:hypothetical protein
VFNKEQYDSEGPTSCISLGLQQFWPVMPKTSDPEFDTG